MKHKDVNIEKEEPFVSCKLNRKKYADVLSAVIGSDATGFVLAINGEWGTGKTTFVKMWRQQLENDGYKTMYFNAWENDFVSEPMIGILGELKTLMTSKSKELFNSILDKASRFSMKIVPTIAKVLANNYLGKDGVEIIEKVVETTADAFEDEIKNYDEKKRSLQVLKKDLKNFIGDESGDKPIIFIIDELDRCRPDYAVEVLEKIKHFFSVEGIVFVLSIDRKQLGNSIRGYYGSDKINADEYLRRFIDIEYTLPEPNVGDFCEYLYDYFEFDAFFRNDERVKYREFKEDKKIFLRLSMLLSVDNHLSLRQIEKLFAYTRLVLRSFDLKMFLYPDLLFLMIYIKYYKSDLYNAFKNHELDIQNLVDKVCEIFVSGIRRDNEEIYSKTFTSIIAKLILFYNNDISYSANFKSLIERTDDKEHLSFSPGNMNEEKLFQLLTYYRSSSVGYDLTLNFFTDKIDLLESLQSK